MNFFECYQRAGKIASEERENARKRYYVGSTLLQICESIENEIKRKGASPAFPVNVSLNDIAAHYTAEPNDETTIKENDVLKIDIGVHVEGYIADTAVTICYDSKHEPLIKAAENALGQAIRVANVNTKASEIGKIIENAISKAGFKSIQNLSGHSLGQYTIHAGKSIPNIWTIGSSFNLLSNQAYAIEPFLTLKDGQGIVYEEADEFLEYLWNKFKTLPFTMRWVLASYEEKMARQFLETLIKRKNIHSYPILLEGNKKVVAQAEHTLIPLNASTRIITL
jgi:methionyl aminopeptidase